MLYLTRFEPGTFDNLANLESLNLIENSLVELHKDLFKDLVALKELHLGCVLECRPARLECGLFRNLSNLRILDLGINDLIELDKDLFQGLTSLKKLDLSYNSIVK